MEDKNSLRIYAKNLRKNLQMGIISEQLVSLVRQNEVYKNSPTDYMTNMAKDHPFIERYNNNKAVVCVGQGDWEEPWSTRYLDEMFHELGINIWVDYWGYDVNHDWPWWYKQAEYFLPYLLGE